MRITATTPRPSAQPSRRRWPVAAALLVVAAMAPFAGTPSALAAGTVPSAPRGVVATPASGQATVAWTAPFDGGSAITTYTVTSSPGGAICSTGGALTCPITGLINGAAYTFTVVATNVNGSSPASAPSGSVTPDVVGSGYVALPPVRILDSRNTVGGWAATPLTSAASRPLIVTGGSVPLDAVAVVMNVTATNSTADSYLTVFPTGTSPPNASNLNFAAGQTIPNLVTARIGSGQVSFATAGGSVDVVADLVGYFAKPGAVGDSFYGINPTRLLDSRNSTGGWGAPIVGGVGGIRPLTVTGAGTNVPVNASAVILNVTATGSNAGSYLQVWPAGTAQPTTGSNLNFAPAQDIANLVVVQVGTGAGAGKVLFFNAGGSTDVVADVVGYYSPVAGSRFHAMNPTRILDDRPPAKGLSGPWGAGQSRALPVGGVSGISQGATGVIMNTTATNGTAGSFLSVYPDGVVTPNSSNLNFGVGVTIPNLVIVRVAADRKVDIYNAAGSVDVTGDVVGYFSSLLPGSVSCEITPADSFWRADVTGLPVSGSSTTWINHAGAGNSLKADFGSGFWAGGPIGIPFMTVDKYQPKVGVVFTYASESDAGGYPVPANPLIEGGAGSSGDRHVLMIEKDACKLYELYSAYPNSNGTWSAGSGVIADMRSDAMRTAGWTSADAAGLQITPGLVQYDEVASGNVQHAIRMTVPSTQHAYVWPASHIAGSDASAMPMGTWLRLKSSVNELAFDPAVRPIIHALKIHGAVIADNGSSWYMSGVPDPRWDNTKLATLGSIKGSDFDIVDASTLQVAPNSYAATTAH